MSISPSIFTSVIESYLPEPHASLLNGIIFGIDINTTKQFYQQVKAVGLLHLVVLSGTNITILGVIVGSMTKLISKQMSTLITILAIILFVLFVRPKAPIVRAAVMGVLTYVAIILGRKNMAIYSLLLSIIFIAIFSPKWLTSVSLYLSYGATLGMIFFGQSSSKKELWKDFKISLSAQFFTAPIIFIYFKQISLISPISNLFISPVVVPLMVFGFMTAVLGKINYFLGLVPAYVCYGLLCYMIWIIEVLSRLPFAFIQF